MMSSVTHKHECNYNFQISLTAQQQEESDKNKLYLHVCPKNETHETIFLKDWVTFEKRVRMALNAEKIEIMTRETGSNKELVNVTTTGLVY